MTPYPSDEVVAQRIAGDILNAANSDYGPATRVALRFRDGPERERDLGGLNRDALIKNILATLSTLKDSAP